MAITRKVHSITVTFDGLGNPAVTLTGIITDDEEGTSAGAARLMKAPAVLNAAEALRDACMAVAENAGKPLTF